MTWHKTLGLFLTLIGWAGVASLAAELSPVPLPPPQLASPHPLMQALAARRSTREFRTNALPVQTLGNLLWAGCGTNRADGHRTVPSALNSQAVDLYVALPEALYRYEPVGHRLAPVAAGDHRARTGSQPFVKTAPVALLFVADLARLQKAKPEDRDRYAHMEAGFISQNVSLYCAAEGLGTVVHDLDREALRELLRLRPEQHVLLGQAVGYARQP